MTQPFPVWVVHARHLSNRKKACQDTLAVLGWKCEWMEDHDPSDLGLRFWLRRVRNPSLTWGEISVYAKQQAVLEQVGKTAAPALVLEDDPVFAEDFNTLTEAYFSRLPEGWDFIFLGASCGLEGNSGSSSPLFARATSTRSMSGYLVTPNAARRAVEALRRRSIRQPVDLTMNEVVAELDLRVYWSVPALIENGSESGHYPRSVSGGRWRTLNPMRLLRRR